MKLRALTAFLLVSACFAPPIQAQSGPGIPPAQYDAAQLREPLPAPGNSFGSDVALSDDASRALVRSVTGVSIFVRSNGVWALEATLPATNASEAALSGDGTVALVADTRAECLQGIDDCGVVRIYVRNGSTWTLAQTIEPPHAIDFSLYFGHDMALSADGSTLLIARMFTNCQIICTGAAYIYRRNGSGLWEFDEELTGPEPGITRFGVSVALTPDGQTALISAFLNDCPAGGTCGVAYVLRDTGGTWVSQGRLTPSQSAGELAVALAADGSAALLGGEAAGGNQGTVFVFELAGAVWTERIAFSGAAAGDRLGNSVDLAFNGRIGIVSAPGLDCPAGADCGAFYWVWRDAANSWHLTAANPLSFPGDSFGNIPVALAADARTALVGVPQAPCAAGGGSRCGLVLVLTAAGSISEIPTLGDLGRILLMLLLAAVGSWSLFTRRSMSV